MHNLNKKTIFLWLFFLVASLYCLVASGHYGGDAVNNYLTTESIVLDRDLRINDRDFSISEMKIDPVQRRNSYSPYGIGMAVLQVPFYLAGLLISKIFAGLPGEYITFFCVSFTNSFLSAINAVLLFAIMVNLGFKRKNAVYLSLIYSFATMAFVYSKTGFAEPALATFLLAAIWALFRHFHDQQGRVLIIASGIALGLMALVKNYSVILMPLFVIYILAKAKKGQRVIDGLTFLIAYILIFSIDLWLNYIRFGGILKSGYGDVVSVGLGYGNHFFKGLYYYLLSSGKGLFFYNIPLVLAVLSWRILYLKNRKEFWLILSLILVYIIYFAYFFKRGSIFSWGPRYLFPVVPLFVIFMEDIFNKKALAYLLIIASLAGFLVQLPAVIMNYSRYIYFLKEKLNIDEYLINFIPDLNHIKGCWQLLISFLHTQFSIPGYVFTYSPDLVLIKPLSSPMAGYDVLDLWFLNVTKVNVHLTYMALSGAILLIFIAVISGVMLMRQIRRER